MSLSSYLFTSSLVLNKDEELFLNAQKVLLLENIRDFGSLSKAAKASGITYKTAWSWIDTMNNLAPLSLVEKVSGGKGGGGTVITSYAKKMMRAYDEVHALEAKHLASLQANLNFLEDNSERRGFSFSALEAKVIAMKEQTNNFEIDLVLDENIKLTAYATKNFVKIHKLEKASKVSLLIESDTVSVSKGKEEKISSRNKLKTEVKTIKIEGNDVLLSLGLNRSQVLDARITLQSLNDLDIKVGDKLMAMFKAYNITLFSGENR